MDGVDFVDQRAAPYHLDDRKSSTRFYLRIFSDLMDVACVNASMVNNMMHQNDLTCVITKPSSQPI